ncbi:MAG: hypothetical protein O7G83_20250 [Proteobacteria bacterium]|nr:hypothetical protein [Pseudomonadota bacterium]
MTGFLDDVFLRLARHARIAAGLAVVLVVAFAMQLRPPTFVGSMVDELAANNPHILAAEQIAAARGNTETIVALIAPGSATIGGAFADLRSLEAGIQQISGRALVRSAHLFAGQLILFGHNDETPLSAFLLGLQQGGGASSLVSKDAGLFGLAADVANTDTAEVLALIRDHKFSSGLETVAVLAAAALEEDVAAGLQQDLRRLIPAIVVVMLGALVLAFGHWRSLVLPVFASIASATVVFSLLSLANIGINLVTLLALPIVMIVALANSCHFLARSSTVLDTIEDLDAVVAATLRRVAVPYLISCLTTAVALASLGLNEIAPIRELGLLASASLVLSFVLIILFAPWALRWHLHVAAASAHPSRGFSRFSAALQRRKKVVAGVMIAAAVASLFALPNLQVKSDPRIFFPDNANFTRAVKLFENRFHVYTPLRILVASRAGANASLPALRFAGLVRDRLRDIAGVQGTTLVGAAGGAGGFLITAFVSKPAAATMLVHELDALQDENAAAFDIVYSSAQLVYEGVDKQALSSLAASLSLSLLLIFGAILLLFRSVRALLAALLANAVPLLIVVGAVWLVGDPLNLVTAFVFLVALGVIVDDTIHILYQHQAGESLAGSGIEFSVVLSTVMLCAGLLLCQLSDFPTTRQFALYFALALTGAVSSDLTLLPLLLNWRKARRRESTSR